jgi:zinc and cadmium transporter
MTSGGTLALYTGAILAGALAGGALPLVGRVRKSDLLLSFSAGVMLGAAFLHMLPEAIESAGVHALPWVLGGFMALYVLERFALVHLCSEPGPNATLTGEAAPHVEGHGHEHVGCEVHTMGWAAFVGMSLHTMVDGFALASASVTPELGLLVFLAILAHKVPNAFSLSAILMAEGFSRRKALLLNAAFALTLPIGVAIYVLLRDAVHAERFTGFALGASAGTFLHLSVSDILPDLHRRGGSKWRISGAVVAGVVLMGVLGLLRHGHAP